MSHEERNAFAGILSSLFMVSYFGWKIWNTFQAGGYDGPDGVSLWAKTVLWMIPVGIVVCIAATILFNIVHAIATNNPNPSFVTDERDTLISRRSMVVTMFVAGAGMILAIIALAMGWQALAGLNIILLGFAFSDIAGNLSRICSYRTGL